MTPADAPAAEPTSCAPRPQGPAVRPRRPDESMTLLNEMMRRPLDPSYAAEAERRRAAGLAPSVAPAWRLALIAFAIGLLLVGAGRALRQPREAMAGQKAALVSQIQSQQLAADALARRQQELTAQVQAVRDASLEGQSRGDLANELSASEVVAGAVAVTGAGVHLTIDDAPHAAGGAAAGDPRARGEQDMGKIISRDLQLVVNGLWTAGAEAIAINGQRLTSTSAIRFAGDAILVDYRPLARPYVVDAIGDGRALSDAFATTDGGIYIQGLADTYGVVYERAVKDSITCPAGTIGVLRHARRPTTAPPPGPSHSATPSTTGSETHP